MGRHLFVFEDQQRWSYGEQSAKQRPCGDLSTPVSYGFTAYKRRRRLPPTEQHIELNRR